MPKIVSAGCSPVIAVERMRSCGVSAENRSNVFVASTAVIRRTAPVNTVSPLSAWPPPTVPTLVVAPVVRFTVRNWVDAPPVGVTAA